MIKNKTKNSIISKEEIQAKTFYLQSRGLMFRKKHNLIMFFNKEIPIYLHNFFVFYPIELLILNKEKKIIEIKKEFKPFTFYNSKKKGKYLIELAFPSNYNLNDQLEF